MHMAEEVKKSKIPFGFLMKVVVFILLLPVSYYGKELLDRDWINQLIIGLSSFLVPSIILSIISAALISLYNTRPALRTVQGNFVFGINRLTTILYVIFLVGVIMVALGKNPMDVLTSLSLAAMAIALIFRDYITNMLSGLFIMFSEQFSVGDR